MLHVKDLNRKLNGKLVNYDDLLIFENKDKNYYGCN